jgi:protein SCO1/2
MRRTAALLLVALFIVPFAQAQAPASAGGPFSLIAGDGRTITEKSFPGRWLIVYFGYTFCPDVCPTTLGAIAEALEKLGPRAVEIQPLFITIDPRRDTPEAMQKYVAAFDKRLIGLTGTPAAIAAAAREYHVFYEREESEGSYLMDHTSWIYVMNPSGEFAKAMPGASSGEAIAVALAALMGSAE